MYFYFPYEPYIAIIGDIKQSKRIEDRNYVQKKLKKTLEEINSIYADDIASDFMITLGDEFQGLLSCGDDAIFIMSEIERKMFPVKIRFGVGIGAITTEINRKLPLGADGPGYYKAREAIEYLKENEKRKQTNASDIRIGIDGDNQASENMLNTILSLSSVIKEEWTDRQREIIWDMLEHQDNQSEVAKRLNIKQPAVQKSLAAGRFYAYKEALDTISKALQEIRGEDV